MFSKLVDAIFPPNCVLCGEPGQSHLPGSGRSIDLCLPCQEDFIANSACCFQCAIPLPLAKDEARARCGECLKTTPAFTHTCAPYIYQWPLDKLVQVFKFKGNLASGRVLSSLLTQAIATDPSSEAQIEAIIPIPLHPGRLRERGFNQAALLAADIAKQLSIPLIQNTLIRQKPSPPQAGLDADCRQKNIKGAFSINKKNSLPGSVALVDDVMTTGSTLREAAKTLLDAGVQRVDCWVIARTP